jgi:hypothetical protein
MAAIDQPLPTTGQLLTVMPAAAGDKLVRLYQLIDLYRPQVEHYRDWRAARTACNQASCDFATFLTEHGLRAQSWPSRADWLGYEERLATPWHQDDSHVVCAVWLDDRIFTVDWTAAQYGRPEFPLVHEFARLPQPNPWLLTIEQATAQMAALREHLAAGGRLV